MGQYHMAVNLDKREFLHPHQLGDGLKLMEQAMSGPGGVGSALILLLAVSNGEEGRGGGDFHVGGFTDVIGRWGGDRVALIGDYGIAADIKDGDILYALCSDDAEDFKDQIDHWRTLGEDGEDEYEALANRAKKLGPFTNITQRVREALEAEGYVKYSGSGWMNREVQW